MYVITTTLKSGATPLVPPVTPVQPAGSWQQLTFFNGSTHIMYVGDSAVSSTNGIPLQPSGSWTVSCALGYTESLNDWYVTGTAADKLTTVVIP